MFFKIIKYQSDLIEPTLIEPPDALITSRGLLVVLIGGAEEQKNSLQGVVNALAHQYFEPDSPQTTPLADLKQALNQSQAPVSSSLVTAAIVGDVLYLAAFGESQVTLKRAERSFPIFNNESAKLIAASGKVKEGDIVHAELKGSSGTDTSLDLRITMEFASQGKPETEPVLKKASQKLVSFRAVAKTYLAKLALLLGSKKEVNFRRFTARQILSGLLALFLIALGTSVYLSIENQNQKKRENEFNELTILIEKNINEAYSIRNLNLEKASELLRSSEEGLKRVKALRVSPERLSQLQAKLAVLAVDLQKKVATSFDLVVDLAALNISALDFTYQNGTLYVLTDKGEVRAISAGKKVVPLAKIDEGKLIRSSKERVYVYGGSGVYRLDGAKAAKVIEPEGRWKSIVDMYAFNNNVYLLDQEAKTVWKYVPGGGGLVFGNNAIGEDGPKVLKKPSSLAIDGNIWVTDENAVYKFLLEKKEDFAVKGFDQKISESTRTFTAEDEVTRSLFILDRGVGRVLQVSKNGQFQSQYSGEEILKALNINYNPAGKQALLLTPTKIVSFKLE